MTRADTRGDLILLSPSANAISALIRKYDRSPYTHIGIDVGDGSFVNCRTEADLLREFEWGGVRRDRFDELTDRRAFRVPIEATSAARDAAVERALGWVEPDGRGTISSFSFPKMFQCAVAVAASRPEAQFAPHAKAALLDSAFDAAEAWAYEPGGTASFFCAEMVVVAYGWKVPASLLAPPAPDDDATRGLGDTGRVLAEFVKEAWERGRRGVTMARVIAAAMTYDREFAGAALSSLWDWLGQPEAPEGTEVTERGDDPLPPALVTPRMLLGCDWVDDKGAVAL